MQRLRWLRYCIQMQSAEYPNWPGYGISGTIFYLFPNQYASYLHVAVAALFRKSAAAQCRVAERSVPHAAKAVYARFDMFSPFGLIDRHKCTSNEHVAFDKSC